MEDSKTISALHRRVALESGNAAGALQQLANLKHVVDTNRKHIKRVVEGGDAGSAETWAQLQEAVHGFSQELASNLIAPAEVTGKQQQYHVLRASLAKEQQRADSLQLDLKKQQDAYEELVHNLETVKQANKQLLEQVSEQTEAIADLTDARVANEERLANEEREHEAEKTRYRHETDRKLRQLRETNAQCIARREQEWLNKMRSIKEKADVILRSTAAIKTAQETQQAELQACVKSTGEQLVRVERDLQHRLSMEHAHFVSERDALSAEVKKTEQALGDEKDARAREVSGWTHQYSVLQAEQEDNVVKLTRDIAALMTRKNGVERLLEQAEKAAADAMEKVQAEIRESEDKAALTEAQLTEIKQICVQLQTQRDDLQAEIEVAESALFDARRRLRQTTDSHASALSGNDHMRAQMEEMRIRFEKMHHDQEKQLRIELEAKQTAKRDEHEASMRMLQEQIEAMEQNLERLNNDIVTMSANCEATEKEVAQRKKEQRLWAQRGATAVDERTRVEVQTAAGRQNWARARIVLIENTDQLEEKKATLSVETAELKDKLSTLKQSFAKKEAEFVSKVSSLEETLKTQRAQLDNAKAQLVESNDSLTRIKNAQALALQKHGEQYLALESQVEAKRGMYDRERQALDSQLTREEADVRQSEEHMAQWRATQQRSLESAYEETRQKLADLERTRVAQDERHNAEVDQKKREVLAELAKLDETSKSLIGSKAKRDAMVQQMNDLRQQRDNLARQGETMRARAAEETRALQREVEEARKAESSSVRLLDSERQKSSEAQKRWAWEVDLAKQSADQAVNVAEDRLRQAQQDINNQLGHLESAYSQELAAEKDKVDSILRDNESLRTTLRDHRSATASLSRIGSQLERNVSQSAAHASALRSSFERAASLSPNKQ